MMRKQPVSSGTRGVSQASKLIALLLSVWISCPASYAATPPAPVQTTPAPTAQNSQATRAVVDPHTGFEQWLGAQSQVSMTKLLANISPNGAARGAVVAGTSRHNPNYFYHWIRDAALVMDIFVQRYTYAQVDEKNHIRKLMSDFVDFTRENQLTQTLTGLGEPKYHADGSAFNDPWGRPQNDGPALRAVTLARYANMLLDEGEVDYVRRKLYNAEIPAHTVIKADLEYVAYNWGNASFDLWEEVKGHHFYTRMSQLAAMREGTKLAQRMGDDGAAVFYAEHAKQILAVLQHHWDGNRGLIRTTLGRVEGIDYKYSDLDTETVLAVLHTNFDGGEFTYTDSRVLATAQKLEEAFRNEYAINDPARFPGVGVAIGRYSEDRYSGQPHIWVGNPWILTTAAFAELHYRLAKHLTKTPEYKIDDLNVKFFQSALGLSVNGRQLSPGLVVKAGTPEMGTLINGLKARGDAFMKRVRIHAHTDGSMAEQIDRNSGYMVSAENLTWSYASYLTAIAARVDLDR